VQATAEPFGRLFFFENGSGTAAIGDGRVYDAQAKTTTKLFWWPFSSSISKKATAAAPSAAAAPKHVQAPSAVASANSNDDSDLEAKAVRHAQEVMRKLAREDERAARQAAKEDYLNQLVAQHIRAAKAAALAKVAAAKAAAQKAVLLAKTNAALAKAAAMAAAKQQQERKLLRAQLCNAALTRQQCTCARCIVCFSGPVGCPVVITQQTLKHLFLCRRCSAQSSAA
jgi:hypothetical protein